MINRFLRWLPDIHSVGWGLRILAIRLAATMPDSRNALYAGADAVAEIAPCIVSNVAQARGAEPGLSVSAMLIVSLPSRLLTAANAEQAQP